MELLSVAFKAHLDDDGDEKVVDEDEKDHDDDGDGDKDNDGDDDDESAVDDDDDGDEVNRALPINPLFCRVADVGHLRH